MKLIAIILFISFFSTFFLPSEQVSPFVTSQENLEYCYNEPSCGPSKWNGSCQSKSDFQSPINIDTKSRGDCQIDQEIFFTPDYFELRKFKLENEGHTIKFRPIESNSNFEIRGPGLDSNVKFTLQNFHFHWGSHGGQGSEHVFNNHNSSAEIHLVHANENKDFIAVIAVLFTEVNYERVHDGFEAIYNELVKTDPLNKGETREVELKVGDFLPWDSLRSYYQYNGSYTTPEPVLLGVLWNIMSFGHFIGPKYLEEFRNKILDKSGHPLKYNFRPLQDSLNRNITFIDPC